VETFKADATAIKNVLLDIKNFDTTIGKFSFDENGSGVYEPRVSIVKDRVLVPLSKINGYLQ